MVHPIDPHPIPLAVIPMGIDSQQSEPEPIAPAEPGFWSQIYLQVLSLLCCSTNNRVEPGGSDSARTEKPEEPEVCDEPIRCCTFSNFFCLSEHRDKYHHHPSRCIPFNEKVPEIGHEFDEWILGEARAPQLRIDDRNAEKLARVLHAYRCIQGHLGLLAAGDLTSKVDCNKGYCVDVREDLGRLVKCRAYCENSECFNLLTVIKHWRECADETCPVCAPCRGSVSVQEAEESENDMA